MAKKKTRTTDKLRFAGYPSATAVDLLRDESGKFKLDKNGRNKTSKIKSAGHLPWGFEIFDTGVREGTYKAKDVHGEIHEGRYAACHRRLRGSKERRTVYVREHELQDNRCLEVVFVDIGQGDGCYMVTPENKKMVIDAGQFANMRHYLNWRYGSSKKTTFEAAIISHPDADHYMGFESLFERDNFFFETVYTNGLMEFVIPDKKKSTGPRPSALGPKQKLKCDDGETRQLVTQLVTSRKELEQFLATRKNWVKKIPITRGKNKGKTKDSPKQFAAMLDAAIKGTKKVERRPAGKPSFVEEIPGRTMGDFQMLSEINEFVPGYDKGNVVKHRDADTGKVEAKEFSIQVLGPAVDTVGGKPMLRWLDSSVSKTKNGHSVVLRLQYGNVSMMLGGDLNIPSEHLLMSRHTGMESPPAPKDQSVFLEAVREVFQVDIAKSCHHGSSDFTHFFLQALNPIATVISSGDDEPHSHPRSDTLGAIGTYSRSNPRPLIFSTELARSSKDENQKPFLLRDEISDRVEDMMTKILKVKVPKSAGSTAKEREELLRKAQDDMKAKLLKDLKEKLVEKIPRSVAVYGAITVVTDGEKVIIYQKLERKGSHGDYDIYRLEPSGKDKNGPLQYQSKH